MRVRDLLEVARWGVNRHGRLKHCGSVTLARTRISSFYRCLSQKYQRNRNNGWSPYTVMMVLVRVGDEGSGRRRLGPYVISNTAMTTNSHHVLSKITPNQVICQHRNGRTNHTAYPRSSAISKGTDPHPFYGSHL